MNNKGINRVRSKIGWLVKKRKLKYCGTNCHVGYNLNLKNPDNISIGCNFIAGKDLTIEVWKEYNKVNTNIIPEIVIGNEVSFMDNCQLSAASKIVIGDGVLFGSNVFVTDNFHGKTRREELEVPPSKRQLYIKGDVMIGKNVWIGRNVCIMPGVTIGDGAIVAANAVVTSNVSPYTVVGGVPAKIIKHIES